MEAVRRIRFSLRVKLALVSLVLLALPWTGAWYVNEVERFLLEGQEQTLLATARAVATALHERPRLIADEDAEVAAILSGLQRASSRILVVNRSSHLVARTGSLKRADGAAPEAPWWQPLVGWLVKRPTEDFTDPLSEDLLASGPDVAAALQGTPGTRTRRTQDDRAVVMSAAHPIWSGEDVVGAVIAEETTNPIASMRSAALERLLLVTLASFAGVAALLIAYATRLSVRIRRLRDEAESAIDARGRITRLAAGSDAADEIGDLSRSFSAVLQRLGQHHAYLESMAGRLSHELRTPIAVVRSSLENLKLASDVLGFDGYEILNASDAESAQQAPHETELGPDQLRQARRVLAFEPRAKRFGPEQRLCHDLQYHHFCTSFSAQSLNLAGRTRAYARSGRLWNRGWFRQRFGQQPSASEQSAHHRAHGHGQLVGCVLVTAFL